MAFQLRILSGKHKGAELRLETRRYALGSSEENALILSDSNIAKKHISFFFAEGEISVLSANGGLLVDGVKIDKFPIDVAPLQVMTLAGSSMDDNVSIAFRETSASAGTSGGASGGASGNEGDDWPDDKKLEELLAKSNLAGANATDAQKTRQAEKKLGAFARIGSRMGMRSKMGAGSESGFGSGFGAERNLVPSTIAIIATLATIALLAIVVLLWFDPARWQAERMKNVEEKLEKELAAKPKNQRTVRIAEEDDGSFVLLGYVETEKELVRLRGLAFESGLQIRVVSKEQLIAAIEVIAREYKLYANFELLPAGTPSTIYDENKQGKRVAMPRVAGQRKRGNTLYSFEDLQVGADKLITAQEFNQRRKRETQHFKLRAEGFVEHERKLDTFKKAILQDLPYIAEVEMDVTTNELMLDDLRNALAKNIAFSGVQLNLDLGQLIISGAIFANFHDEMQDILQEQYQKLPRAPTHKERITLAPPFYAKITALLLGRQRAVDLRMRKDSQPKRYLVGQLIDNDKTVIAIADNGIILNYRNEDIGFPISNTAVNLPALKQERSQREAKENSEVSSQGDAKEEAKEEAEEDAEEEAEGEAEAKPEVSSQRDAKEEAEENFQENPEANLEASSQGDAEAKPQGDAKENLQENSETNLEANSQGDAEAKPQGDAKENPQENSETSEVTP